MSITTTILGASGYAGQETLDRVLAHPELELVALGSDSLAGQGASVLDPRLNGNVPAFVSNDAALAAGAELVFCCLDHERAALLDAPADVGRRRSLRRAPARAAVALRRVVRLRASAAAGAAGVELRDPRALPADRAADREPRLLRDRRAARARAARGRGRAERRRRRREVGRLGRGQDAEGQSSHAASVLENVSPYKVGSHQHAPEIEQALGFPVCFVPHLLPVRRGLIATCYVQSDADVRELLEAAYATSPAVTLLPEGVAPELSRVQGTDGAELGVFTDRATGTRIVVCAIDNLGKGAAGQAVQNANLALGLPETAGLRLAGVLGMSVTAAKGFVASGVARGHPAQGARPRGRPLDRRPRSARRCSPSTRCWPRRSSSRRSISRSPSRRRS